MPDASMPSDRRPADRAPVGWGAAFAALPLEQPAADPWPRVAMRLGGRRTLRWPLGLAAAAALVLAVALPLRFAQQAPVPDDGAAELERLYAQSAQLETLLAWARDERVASGNAVAVATRLDARIAGIDAALAQPGLPPQRQRALWQERVDALRELTVFEANRRWLATRGERYDVALVRVD